MDGRSSTTAGEDRIEVEGGALMIVCSDLWVDKSFTSRKSSQSIGFTI